MAKKGAVLAAVFALSSLFPSTAAAQTSTSHRWRPEVSGSLAWGHLARAEDETFGDELNLAGMIGVHHASGLGFEVELNKTFGLTPDPVTCGVVRIPCVGEAVSGVRSNAIASGNVLYTFGSGRVRPYVIGGVGIMWTDWANSITFVRNGLAEISQLETQDTGLSISAGAGLRVAVAERISVRTEFRVYDSTLMSRSNLGLMRVSAGLSVGW